MHLRKLTLKVIGLYWLGLVVLASPSFGSGANGDQAVKQMQAQANTMKERLIEARDKEIDAHTSSVQDKIQAVNESAEIEIAKVPRFFYNAWGYPVPNPDYERTVAYIRVDAQKQINAINKDLMAMTKTINSTYQEKLNAIDSSLANVGSQTKAGTSDVQLTPVGSNLYVKNYVNYAAQNTGGTKSAPTPPAKGLRPRENSLACKTTRHTEKKDLTNGK